MKKASVTRLIFFYFLINMFANVAHPITPTMFINKGFPDYMFGVSFASMSFAMMATSPFWGRVGDRIGHIKTAALTIPFYGVVQMIFMLTNSIVVTTVARFLSGFFSSATFVCTMAYLINLTTEENRGRFMSYYVAVNSVGAAFGYTIGGVVGNKSIITVFIIQLVAFVVLGALLLLTLEDSEKIPNKFSVSLKINNNSIGKLKQSMPAILVTFLIAVFLTNFATIAYDSAFNYYLRDELLLPSTYNGIVKAVIGIVTLIVNFTVNIYIVNHTDTRKSIIVVLLLCGITSLIAPLIKPLYLFFAGNIVFFMFNSIYLPIQQDLVTKVDESNTSGVISGIFNAVRSGGMIFGSLFGGFIYSFGSILPFISASVVFFISVFVSYINLRQYKRKLQGGIGNWIH